MAFDTKKSYRRQIEDATPMWQDAIERLEKHFQDKARRQMERLASWANRIRISEAEKEKQKGNTNG